MNPKDFLSRPQHLCLALDQTPLSQFREKDRAASTFEELALRNIFRSSNCARALATQEFNEFASSFIRYSQDHSSVMGEANHDKRVCKIAYLVLANLGSMLAQLESRTDSIHFWLSDAREAFEAKTLLALGAHPNVLSRGSSRSCLHLSALHFNIETLQLLSESPLFDPNYGCLTGETALFVAVHAYGRELPGIELEHQRRWIKGILQDERTDPNCVTPTDRLIPLHLAAKKLNTTVLNVLLNDERINPNVQGEPNLYTPLHFAAVNDLGNSVRALARHPHTDFEKENAKGETPLGLAIRKGKSNAVIALVESGARITLSHLMSARLRCRREFPLLFKTFVQRCTRKPYF